MPGALAGLFQVVSVPSSTTVYSYPPANETWLVNNIQGMGGLNSRFWHNGTYDLGMFGEDDPMNGGRGEELFPVTQTTYFKFGGGGSASTLQITGLKSVSNNLPIFVGLRAAGLAMGLSVRPPAGKVWKFKKWKGENCSAIPHNMKAAAGSVSPNMTGFNNTVPGNHILTNDLWLETTAYGGYSPRVFLLGFELSDTELRPKVQAQTWANGVTYNFAPPAGETWVFLGWQGGTGSTVSVYDGTTLRTVQSSNYEAGDSSHMMAAVSDSMYFRIVGGGYLGFVSGYIL